MCPGPHSQPIPVPGAMGGSAGGRSLLLEGDMMRLKSPGPTPWHGLRKPLAFC